MVFTSLPSSGDLQGKCLSRSTNNMNQISLMLLLALAVGVGNTELPFQRNMLKHLPEYVLVSYIGV